MQDVPDECPEGPKRVGCPRVTKNNCLNQLVETLQSNTQQIFKHDECVANPYLVVQLRGILVCVVWLVGLFGYI